MKTKTTSNPGPLSRALFTSLLAIAAACLSVGTTRTADSQSDLLASFNGGGVPGLGSIVQYAPDGTPSPFASNLDAPRGLAFDSAAIFSWRRTPSIKSLLTFREQFSKSLPPV